MSDELTTIDDELKRLATERDRINEEEAYMEAQIAALRFDIAKLKDQRASVRRQTNSAVQNRESALRRIELAKEAERIEAELADRTAEYEELLKDAPWKDSAFPWQIEGAKKLPDRAVLADKRGMGKTLSSLIWRRLHKSRKTLVCLRKEVSSDFIKEIRLREPNVLCWVMVGVPAAERKMVASFLEGFDEYIVVTNIESWRRDAEGITKDILDIGFDGVILDEAHHIKNSNTGTAQGFFHLADAIPKVLELTGTPLKNKPQEMFSLFHAVYPDLFPTEKFFLRDFCTQIDQNKWVFSQFGLAQLVKKISHFYLARSPDDIGRKVPPPKMIEYQLDFEAHEQQKQAYRDITERAMAVLTSGTVIPIVAQLAIMIRQAQIVSWPAGINFEIKDEWGVVQEVVKFDIHQSVKMDWAEDLLIELTGEDERVIVFSRFKPALYEMKRRLELKGISVAVITGDEKGSRAEIFDDFDLKTAPENPKYQVLLATYQTVGESANLNAARHMILYDRFWNPGNEDQAVGRIDRINSIDQATVHIPLVDKSIDIYMTELINDKRNIVQDFGQEMISQASLTEHLRKSLD